MAGLNNEDIQRQVLLQQLGKKTNHILHLLLSVCTLGFWIPVWIIISINNNLESSRMIDIANSGKVSVGTKFKTIILVLVIVALFAPFFIVISGLAGGK